MNPRRAPNRIFAHHTEDQFPHLLGSLSSPNWPSHFGNQLPVQPEASSMPTDHRFRSHYDKSIFPSGPKPSRQDPEELIEYPEPWSGMSPFKGRELLPKREVFKQKIATRTEQVKNRADQESQGFHHARLLSRLACGTQRRILLKLQADTILSNDT